MNKKAAYRPDELIFLMAVIIFYISVLLNLTVIKVRFGQVYTLCMYLQKLSYILLAISVLFQTYRTSNFYIGIIMICVSVIAAITLGESIVMWGVIAIVAGNCTNSRKVIKAVLITQIVVFAITFILCGAGVIQDYIFDPETRARHSLGFTWTTTPIIIFMFMIMEYCYLRSRDLTLFEICLLEVLMTILFVLTNTRMCYAVTTLMLIVIALNKYFKWRPANKVKKNTGKGMVIIPWIIFAFVLTVSFMYSNSASWEKVNLFFNFRLSLAHNAINTYGIHLVGNPIKWIGFGYGGIDGIYNYVDSSYIQALLSYGVLFMIMILAVYSCIFKHAKKNGYAIVIAAALLISITEPRLWNLTFNPLPFLLIDAVKDRNSFSTQEVVSNV